MYNYLLTLGLLLFSSCLRVLRDLLHLAEKHLDGDEHLVPHVLLLVDGESAECREDPRGNVPFGVEAVGGSHRTNCSAASRREGVLQGTEESGYQHFLSSLRRRRRRERFTCTCTCRFEQIQLHVQCM